jgi:Ca2+-binding RTX toxin-like protein
MKFFSQEHATDLDYSAGASLFSAVEGGSQATTIPNNALDAKNFSSIDAWLDACIARGVPGKIGSGTYIVDGEPRYAPIGIYGYGDTPPKFVSTNPSGAWLYVKDADVTLDNLAFEDFGRVLVGAVDLSKGPSVHSSTDYNFKYVDTHKSALAMDVKGKTSEVSPEVTINNSTFTNVETVYTFTSNSTKSGKVEFTNNQATGTWGLVDINAPLWTEVIATGNEWADATGSRAQPTYKSQGVQTGFRIGTETSIEVNGHTTKLDISDNYAHDIQSYSSSADYNAAVFADVRGAISKKHGDNVIADNDIVRLKGMLGQEDSNAIYAKAWGLIIKENHIVDSGADYVDNVRNGSEATGILVKPFRDGIAKDIEIIGNVFEDMPTMRAGMNKDLAVIKLSEAVGESSISGNTFIGGGNLSNSDNAGLIRYYGTVESLDIMENKFVDIKMANDSQAIVLSQLSRYRDVTIEISYNSASLTQGTYTADGNWIGFTSDAPGTLITGHNTLEGGFVMVSDRVGIPAEAGLALSLSGSNVSENVPSGTEIGRLSVNEGGPYTFSVVDSLEGQFAVVGNKLVAGGALIDYESGASRTVTIRAIAADGTSFDTARVITVRNVDEAPTGVDILDLQSVSEDATGSIVVARFAVLDPDTNEAFRTYTARMDDSRFTVVGDEIVLRAGSAINSESEPEIDLLLTVTSAGRTLTKALTVDVTDSGEAEPSEGEEPSDNAIVGTNAADQLFGLGGDDELRGLNGNDVLDGRGGDDVLIGGLGADRLIGRGGTDAASYQGAAAEVRADLLTPTKNTGEALGDTYSSIENLIGSDNADWLGGNHKRNTIYGGAGDDFLNGQGDADTLYGEAGNDTLQGGGGNDRLEGGAGNDTLNGGASGRDWFVFSTGEWGHDVVQDFEDGVDLIDFRGSGVHFDDLSITQSGSGVLVAYEDGSSILLNNLALAQVTVSDFLV